MRTFDRCFSPSATGARWPRWPTVSGLIISPSTAPKTSDGELLIFEADNTAVVHNMDSPEAVPLQAAADAQDLRGVRRDAVRAAPGATASVRRRRAGSPKKMLAYAARG